MFREGDTFFKINRVKKMLLKFEKLIENPQEILIQKKSHIWTIYLKAMC